MKRFTTAALLVALTAAPLSTLLAQSVRPTPAAPPGATAPKADANVVRGKVDAVTVYRGQALVTRLVDLPAAAGLSEVVISELPERLVPSSLFAESADGIEVRSVRYRERPVSQDVRDEVRTLDAQLRKLSDDIQAIQKQQTVLAEQRSYLEKLSNFVAPTATMEMTKGVLNAEQLKALTNYQFESRKSIAEQELANASNLRKLQEELSLKQRERNEIANNSARTLREAVVFIHQDKAGGKLRLRYLVDNATWAPSYNVRADAERKSASIEYQASIEQMSGEDWSDVTMTLSTATPSLVANAPLLNPLTITLGARGSDPTAVTLSGGSVDYKVAKQSLTEQRQQEEFNRNARRNWDNQFGAAQSVNQQDKSQLSIGNSTINVGGNNTINNDLNLNKIADQLQVLELVAKETRKDEDRSHRVKSSEGIVVTYQLRNKTSLPSRADRQLIQIDSFPVKSQFYKVAVPVLTNYVYDEATMTNTSKTVMLAGPVASYVGGQFVGNGEVQTVATGQTFTVGFGIDASLRATRERIDRTETVQGGNKVVGYSYRIAIENFGAEPAAVRIMDRLPTAKDSEVKINFADASNQPLSQDKEYQQFDRKKGLLRWDVQVPAQKNGAEAFSLSYKLEMEYDKNLAISASNIIKLQELEKMMTH